MLFVVAPARAADPFDLPLPFAPSSATVQVDGDGWGSLSNTYSVDLGLRSGNRLRGSYTAASIESENYEYGSDTYVVGIHSDPLDTLSYGMNYRYVERDDNLTTDTVDGALRWRPRGWTLSLLPEVRYISLGRDNIDLRVGIRNPGLGASVTYRGLEHWSFMATHYEYSYSTDLSELATQSLFVRLLSTRLGEEFDESRTTLATDVTFDRLTIGVTRARSIAAVDQAETIAWDASANWDVTDHVGVFGYYGRSWTDGVDDADFGGGGISVYWD